VGVTGPVSERIVFLSASEATMSAEENLCRSQPRASYPRNR
jgi:hypothetical protein